LKDNQLILKGMLEAEAEGYHIDADPLVDDHHPGLNRHWRDGFEHYGAVDRSDEEEDFENDEGEVGPYVEVLEPNKWMDASTARHVGDKEWQQWLKQVIGPWRQGSRDDGAGRFELCLALVRECLVENGHSVDFD
jgi:hypothetical protein